MHRRGEIWLPRQDQLQEMLETKGWARQLEEISQFANDESRNFEWSWEQFWLALVMKKNWNKVWKRNGNEENWVKEENDNHQ